MFNEIDLRGFRGFMFKLFKETPWRWVLCWIIAPAIAVIAMWPVGGPSMATPLAVAAMLAFFFSRREAVCLRRVGVVLIFITIGATYVTRSFNIGLTNIWRVSDYTGELNLAQAPEYVIGGILLAATLGLALWFAPKTKRFQSRDQWIMAIAMVALVINIDNAATASVRGSYKATAPAGEQIDSAMLQNDINPSTVEAKNLVVVIVESWGVPVDPHDVNLEREIWNSDQWSRKYEVAKGTSKYFGSTTNAEVREWCAVWADHNSFDFDNSRCLTHLFRDAGFHTTAMHSFKRDFFAREEWYPKLGFEDVYFDQDLMANGARFCDGVFAGACDQDIPQQIGDILRSSKHDRNLIYWLTVNAHLPVSADPILDTETCNLGDREWGEQYSLLCRSYQVHKQVADAITIEVMRDDFPESDILIVGDHMPPFFPRSMRVRFNAELVPWIYLKAKSSDEAAEIDSITKVALAR